MKMYSKPSLVGHVPARSLLAGMSVVGVGVIAASHAAPPSAPDMQLPVKPVAAVLNTQPPALPPAVTNALAQGVGAPSAQPAAPASLLPPGPQLSLLTGSLNLGFNNVGIFNTGIDNAGIANIGNFNTGDFNIGSKNSANFNIGIANDGDFNIGRGNTGKFNVGVDNSGKRNFGIGNTGTLNVGLNNTGTGDVGLSNTGNFIIGVSNVGIHYLPSGAAASSSSRGASVTRLSTADGNKVSPVGASSRAGQSSPNHTTIASLTSRVGKSGSAHGTGGK